MKQFYPHFVGVHLAQTAIDPISKQEAQLLLGWPTHGTSSQYRPTLVLYVKVRY